MDKIARICCELNVALYKSSGVRHSVTWLPGRFMLLGCKEVDGLFGVGKLSSHHLVSITAMCCTQDFPRRLFGRCSGSRMQQVSQEHNLVCLGNLTTVEAMLSVIQKCWLLFTESFMAQKLGNLQGCLSGLDCIRFALIVGLLSQFFLCFNRLIYYLDPSVLSGVSCFVMFLCLADYLVPALAPRIFGSSKWYV